MEDSELEHHVWEILGEMARAAQREPANDCFQLEGEHGVEGRLAARIGQPASRLGLWFPKPAKQALRRVFFEAAGRGLLVPSNPGQALDWSPGTFSFSPRGVRYFQSGIELEGEGDRLRAALLDAQTRLGDAVLSDGRIQLVMEAQRCWRHGLYRAGAVLIGVTSEDACSELLDALDAYPAGSRDPANVAEWGQIRSAPTFQGRWAPALRILERIRRGLRGHQDEAWYRASWNMNPASLQVLGEAIRVKRNDAAHDAAAVFSRAELGLLLAALPFHLELVARATAWLQAPPPGVTLPMA